MKTIAKLKKHCRFFPIFVAALSCQYAVAAYPEKPIRFIVPAGAGGAADATSRIVGTALAQRLGQAVVIENKPGAAGTIGLNAIAKADSDGYTIGTNALSSYTMTALVSTHVPYNIDKDFTPIAVIATQPYLLGVNAALPIKNVKDLVAYSKAHPGELFYGSSGNGSSLQVVTELLRATLNFDATHVAYKTVVAAETDLMGGQIQMMIDNFSTMAPNVKSGRVRAIMTTSAKRSPILPEVPTAAELGLPNLQIGAWAGIVGPAGLSQEIVKKLNFEINAILADPKIIKQLADIASDAIPMTPAEFTKLMQSDKEKWGPVIKKANITAD